MPRAYDPSIQPLLCLPSMKKYYYGETGRSNFMEAILKIVDATGHRESFEKENLFCIYIKNRMYTPLFLIAEDKYSGGNSRLRLVDVRMPKYRALMTAEGFPLIVTQQIRANEVVQYKGIVLEQDYAGSYTGNVDHIDLIGLAESMVHIDMWGEALVDAGFVEAAANAANVEYTNNRYVFEQEFKVLF